MPTATRCSSRASLCGRRLIASAIFTAVRLVSGGLRTNTPASVAHLERLDEGLLRDVHLAELAHPLLAFLLFLQKFALAGDVAAVTLRGDVLAQRRDGFTRDDFAADRRLDRDLE